MVHKKTSTKQYGRKKGGLLKDLSEIKEVLDVESQLMRALVKMALQRQPLSFRYG